MEQPENLNEMYLLANQWLTTTTKTHLSGLATTFTTTCDRQETNKNTKKQSREKKKEENKKDEKSEAKKNKDLSNVECCLWRGRPLCKQLPIKTEDERRAGF